jgi:hypothetical protein
VLFTRICSRLSGGIQSRKGVLLNSRTGSVAMFRKPLGVELVLESERRPSVLLRQAVALPPTSSVHPAEAGGELEERARAAHLSSHGVAPLQRPLMAASHGSVGEEERGRRVS